MTACQHPGFRRRYGASGRTTCIECGEDLSGGRIVSSGIIGAISEEEIRTMIGIDELEIRFSYHKPKGDQSDRYVDIRDFAKNLAFRMREACPESRELSLAYTHLETAVMFANAAIARRE